MAKETVLITGASSGIGEALAERFARDGARLILVARREDRMAQLKERLHRQFGTESLVHAADLSDPAAPAALFDALQAGGDLVDVLVNNAGFGGQGAVATQSMERQMSMIQVNVAALTHLTRLFLPGMIERGRGGVLNVASTAAFQPGPYMAVYYATKAYVLSFSEALAEEVRGSGVHVTCLAPGPTRSEFQETAGLQDAALFRYAVMNLDPVVDAAYKAFRKGRVLVIPGLLNRLGASASRVAPRRLVPRIVASLQR